MTRARAWIVFLSGLGLGYVVALAVAQFHTLSSVTISEICAPEPGGSCVFERSERTYGLDYTTTQAFFRTRKAAMRGGFSTTRIECDPESAVDPVWRDGVLILEIEYGCCEARGEDGHDLRQEIAIRHDSPNWDDVSCGHAKKNGLPG